VSKNYYWAWNQGDKEKSLFYGENPDYTEYAEPIGDDPTGIEAVKLLECLQDKARNSRNFHMMVGYEKLYKILSSGRYMALPERIVKGILREIIEQGGIHDE
jgi:hypothetical protein